MKQSTNKVEFILDEYEYFEDLYIENGASDVRLVKTKRPNVRVVAVNLSKYRVFVEKSILFVKEEHEYKYRAPFAAKKNNKRITIYLPENKYNDISIYSHYGAKVVLPKTISFATIDASVAYGTLICSAPAKHLEVVHAESEIIIKDNKYETLYIDTTASLTKLQNVKAKEITIYRAPFEFSEKVQFTNVSATKDIKIDVYNLELMFKNVIARQKLTINSDYYAVIKLNNIDATKILIILNKGSVSGTLSSAKEFDLIGTFKNNIKCPTFLVPNGTCTIKIKEEGKVNLKVLEH